FPFREYSSIQGRWLSPDPAGLAAVNPANPQTWNAYAYVANQPLEYTDPTGLITQQAMLTPVACPSPWMCLDPAYWQFVFNAAAEAMQIDQGGGVAPIETVAIHGRIQTAPPVGPSCGDALSAAGRGPSLTGVNAADANWAVLASAAESHGIPTPVLAAIGVYESGFADIRQGRGGIGVGVFQNDSPPNPPVAYTQNLQQDLPSQARAAAALLQGADSSLLRQGFGPGLALLGAIRDYNGTGHIPTQTLLEAGPQYVSLGTTGNDYVSNVVEIAASCF
ncbi:MAG: RHS repeat-associated core domain-containing protein, partial [Terriglobales bacterium]